MFVLHSLNVAASNRSFTLHAPAPLNAQKDRLSKLYGERVFFLEKMNLLLNSHFRVRFTRTTTQRGNLRINVENEFWLSKPQISPLALSVSRISEYHQQTVDNQAGIVSSILWCTNIHADADSLF